MPLQNARYTVLVGNYGSGKTELSLALARYFRRRATGSVALVDLDIVNPYFRSAEKKDVLEREGVEVLMPSFAMTTVDVPSLPAEIQRVFQQPYDHVVLDVGGDAVGAAALGAYAPLIAPLRDQMQVLYVVNTFRPLSSTEQDIEELYGLIAERSRLTPDGLVNNANLQSQTSAQDLIDAQALLSRVAAHVGTSVALCAGEERLQAGLPPEMQAMFFPVAPMMLPEWMTDDD